MHYWHYKCGYATYWYAYLAWIRVWVMPRRCGGRLDTHPDATHCLILWAR
ncbi:hypothetical protein BIFGAL_04089 [Bifidobacterium gallicum DSM 20093 = LMG 11596]|uniref:Uncharacterized protein n=1 Tax=Bifidobacterium gallicum DSM 20093 = LMG 11596 TaxID=561180 RepID=D1NW44_9BIFI|nr:hypothetical protein BIFGAL_04089 [Bifidobacterium gallicum DSM 20093 = LMG 11596]